MTEATASTGTTTRGILLEQSDDAIVLGLPGTDYRLHLVPSAPISTTVGRRITGRIRAEAMRVDIVPSGGRYIEPVYGRPRRLQGRIIATDRQANSITIACACPIECTLTADQTTADMPIGAIASFDVKPGATFEPMEK